MGIFDYDDGDFLIKTSSTTAMDSDGNMMMRMSDNMAMVMDKGDIHLVSSWEDQEDRYISSWNNDEDD